MEFAYVTFVNNHPNYIELMKSTIKSVEVFSKHPIIVYCVDMVPESCPFDASEKCILRFISKPHDLINLYYLKPYVIIDAILQGLKSGYYIESDDLLTPVGDSIVKRAKYLDKFPISPIHPSIVKVSEEYMRKLGVERQTQHYIHGHVLFKDSNLPFLKEWLENCKKSEGEHWDETALNCTYWKHNLGNHYLEVIDPWYECIFENMKLICHCVTVHGCKDSNVHKETLHRMIEYYIGNRDLFE